MLSKGIPNKIKVTTITFKKIMIIKILRDNYIAILIKFDKACHVMTAKKYYCFAYFKPVTLYYFSHFPCHRSGCSSSVEVLPRKATFLT